ncbi:MAG: hypothetical protein JWN73_3210 [Betaproteobacteria bacterium]|nr:hypothetical protein [Betaproteobacteria bacterium]
MLGQFLRKIGGKRQTAQFHARSPSHQAATASGPVYFANAGSWSVTTFGPRIVRAMPDRVSGVISDRLAKYCPVMSIGHDLTLPVVSLAAFREVAGREPVQVVHFFDDLDQYWMLDAIKACGPDVTVVDFLSKLYDFNLPHTYQNMLEEQAWWQQHLSEVERIAVRFGDQQSLLTLQARVESIMSADRRPLIEVSLPMHFEYFNNSSRYASLVPGEDDILVDIGAAHGDTVDKFRSVTAGRYRQILAFEPTPGQYRTLATREVLDPRIKTFQQAVGDTPGVMPFYDDPSSPFLSNALIGETKPIEVQCVRLDDVVERCTIIKVDVEGFEPSVLRGAKRLIRESRPDLAIACYHYAQDLMEILDLVMDTHAYQNVALRHYSPYLYDTVLMFSDRQAFDT